VLAGSELLLLRLTAYRGLWLLEEGTVMIVIEEQGELRVAACRGEQSARLLITPVEGSALGALFRAGESLAQEHPSGTDAAWLHELGLEARAALIEPLREGQVRGMVIALRRKHGFPDSQRDEFRAFAASVGRDLAELRDVEIRRLRYGMEARERERTRWAREIHDESIQGMGALRMKLASARDAEDSQALRDAVEAVLEGLGHEIDGLRHLITELRPAALDDLGLAAALEALARRAQAIDGLDVSTEIALGVEGTEPADSSARRLDAELESTIYRIVQEALTNVSRHAEATRAAVSITERDGEIVTEVTDDGRGMPGAERLGPRGDGLEGGFGMSGMRERAELVGGELDFAPAPGGGTKVTLRVPLAGRPSAAEEAAAASDERRAAEMHAAGQVAAGAPAPR
jgi:signal transduction histidine kinase